MASFLESEAFHQKGVAYIEGLERGEYIFHLPMLVVVEVTSALSRRVQTNRQAFLVTWKQNVADWEQDGKLVLYALDRDRMNSAVKVAEQHRLSGSDAVIASLAEELDMSLRTFDIQVRERFQRASV